MHSGKRKVGDCGTRDNPSVLPTTIMRLCLKSSFSLGGNDAGLSDPLLPNAWSRMMTHPRMVHSIVIATGTPLDSLIERPAGKGGERYSDDCRETLSEHKAVNALLLED